MTNYATGKKFLPVLCDALGLDQKQVQRVVLDVRYDDLVRAYVEMIGQGKLIDIAMPAGEIAVTMQLTTEEGDDENHLAQ